MKNLTIQVTRVDIQNGRARSCEFCPIALAAARALGELPGRVIQVTVGYGAINWRRFEAMDGLIFGEAVLPDAAAEFIRVFDETGAVAIHLAPFHFVVDLAAAEWGGVE